ncbi:MAG TPA: hypothetical protein VKB17_08325 [Thermoleophilaceae bacterium]|nr:hypothetical protein [Thermoleophilaceae bacterium]
MGRVLHLLNAHTPSAAKVAVGRASVPEAASWTPDPDFKVDSVLDKAATLTRADGAEVELHAPGATPRTP